MRPCLTVETSLAWVLKWVPHIALLPQISLLWLTCLSLPLDYRVPEQAGDHLNLVYPLVQCLKHGEHEGDAE